MPAQGRPYDVAPEHHLRRLPEAHWVQRRLRSAYPLDVAERLAETSEAHEPPGVNGAPTKGATGGT
eukprot:6684770-Pyramimonas_sp.AAC.1